MPSIRPRPLIFRPSCVLSLYLRFEQSLKLDPSVVPVIPTSTQDAATNPVPLTKPSPRPLFMDGFADRNSQPFRVVPKTWNIEWAGYRQAGKFSFTVDWNVIRIDPRTITSAAVEFYLGAVSDDNFATGLTGALKGIYDNPALVPVTEDNLVMVGSVDNWSVKWTASGADVTADGRDLRGILLDSPAGSELFSQLDLSQNILQVARQLLDRHPLGGNFPVAAYPDEWPGGRLPSLAFDGARTRGRKSANGQKVKVTPKTASGQGDTTYWEVLTYACYQVGAIPFFRGREIILRRSRSFFDLRDKAGTDASIPTPFADGQVRVLPNGEKLRIRRMVYGADLSELSFEKKLQGKKGVVFEVRSYNQSSTERGVGKLLKARWPDVNGPKGKGADPKTAATTLEAPSGKVSDSDVIPIYVQGITDKAALQSIAQQIYEEATRGEMGGSFTTKNLASQGGDNSDADLLRLQVGDPIEILLRSNFVGSGARSPLIADLMRDVSLDFDAQVARVTERVWDPVLARVIVATARSAILQLNLNIWRVSGVKLVSNSGGVVTISADFQNYLTPVREVRTDESPNPVEQRRLERLVAPLQKQVLLSSRPKIGDAL